MDKSLNSLSAQWSFRTGVTPDAVKYIIAEVSIAFRLNGLFGHA